MKTEIIEKIARRALELVRERHNYRFAVMHAVFEFGGDECDFRKVLSVLKDLLKGDNTFRFVYRKITRALEGSSEPQELQTCFPARYFHGIE